MEKSYTYENGWMWKHQGGKMLRKCQKHQIGSGSIRPGRSITYILHLNLCPRGIRFNARTNKCVQRFFGHYWRITFSRDFILGQSYRLFHAADREGNVVASCEAWAMTGFECWYMMINDLFRVVYNKMNYYLGKGSKK